MLTMGHITGLAIIACAVLLTLCTYGADSASTHQRNEESMLETADSIKHLEPSAVEHGSNINVRVARKIGHVGRGCPFGYYRDKSGACRWKGSSYK
uniref:Uncharacterized protein n=1 Tax=Anopheles albimanus TaxID=7167 RepID=A0A182FWS0_ANOAL